MSPAGVLRHTKMLRVSSRLCISESVLRTMPSLVLALALISLFPGVAKQQQQPGDASIAIVGATIVDGTGRAPFQADVLLRGGRIAAVGPDLALPQDARVIRADGQTLLPGLFDLHTHLPNATVPGITGDWPKHLAAYLYCGVTSVVDFGTYPETFEPMRRLLGSGAIEGPRLHLAARMTTPGGHGAEGGRGDFFTLEAQTPREARDAVRRVIPYRPDAIKVFTDGWRYNTAPDMTSMNQETLSALVEEAHKNGIPVLTHTVTLERSKVAARAAVDVIVHGIGDREADNELIELMRAKGTAYVSTLAVYEPRGRNLLSPLLPAVLEPAVRETVAPALPAPGARDDGGKAPLQQRTARTARTIRPDASENASATTQRSQRWKNLLYNVSALKTAGIRLGVGTDAGVTGTHHGWATLHELQLLVAGGLSPAQAITAATFDSARALRVDNERGSVAAGKVADLVLVAGAPHQNISDIERIARVFLGGREIDRESLARRIASKEPTRIEAIKVSEKIDDFETAGDASIASHAADSPRSALGTLWITSTDPGHDHSRLMMGRILRAEGGYALSILARMSLAQRPFVRVSVPLTPGAFEPGDARAFRGIRFDARGDGFSYRLIVPTRSVRNYAYFQAPFKAASRWETIRIDFAMLEQEKTQAPAAWTGSDLMMLSFEIARPGGGFGWLELDNIRFY
jgi:imidazolonepropionase-like amidohydrolase